MARQGARFTRAFEDQVAWLAVNTSKKAVAEADEDLTARAKTITEHRAGIEAAIHHGLSNTRTEQANTQIRLITRRAYSFRSPDALITLAMLTLSGLCPPSQDAPPDPRKRHKTPIFGD